jgi:uncharacterized membrane protein
MSIRTWWKRKSAGGKLVTALAWLLMLEIGLFFSLDLLARWYVAIFGRMPDPYFPLGQGIGLILLSIATLALLILVMIVMLVGEHDFQNRDSEEDSDH